MLMARVSTAATLCQLCKRSSLYCSTRGLPLQHSVDKLLSLGFPKSTFNSREIMAGNRHKEHLKQFFTSHKDGGEKTKPVDKTVRRASSNSSVAGETSKPKSGSKIRSNNIKSPEKVHSQSTVPLRRPMASGTNVTRGVNRRTPQVKPRPTAEGIPDEIWRCIFALLNPNDLLICARVCRRWLELSNDNLIWEKVYQRYVINSKRGQTSNKTHPKHPPASYWKSQCIKRCSDIRNKTALASLKKIHPFTGLPANTEKALKGAGVRWCLTFIDSDSIEYTVMHRDAFFFSMATCVRWYSLDMPPIGRIRKLRMYSANPVFFDVKGSPHPNSPCQRSLMFEMDFRWSNMSSTVPVVAADDSVNIVLFPNNLMIATWKDGGELAFITTSLHFHQLVPRCLSGQGDSPYLVPQHEAQADDLDSKRGLHSYKCTVELRNQRNSFFSQQFREVYCQPEDIGDGYARFRLIREESSFEHSPVGKKISFPWKTDVFKGIVQNVCFLDVALLDESAAPMWCVSAPVRVATPSLADVVYDYDGDHFFIDYIDPKGKVKAKLVWEEEIGQYIIMTLDILLSLSHINSWFATSYK